MEITARVSNSASKHVVEVTSDGRSQSLPIAGKSSGYGSAVNGGELLFAALATCFCNDLYREAARRDIVIHAVVVEVTGQFGARGEPARDISYRVNVESGADEPTIRELLVETDVVSEIQNTLRRGCAVRLVV